MVAGTADVVVVGGGAAGLMAAASAAACGCRVVVLERGDRPGRKLLASGNGRCNLTNADADAVRHYHGGGSPRLVRAALRRLSVAATLEWFARLGLETLPDSRGRVFPRCGQARAVVALLTDRLAVAGVSLLTGQAVQEVRPGAGALEVHSAAGAWHCRRVVMATGGPSASRLGADRSGIDLVCRLGHRAVELLPGLVPLVSPDPWVHRMQGARVEAVVSARRGGGERVEDCGEVLFTSYGLSGPVILNLSARLVPWLRRGPMELVIDLFPERSPEQLSEMLKARWEANPHRSLTTSLIGLLPDRVAGPLVEGLGLPGDLPARDATRQQRWSLAQGLHAWRVPVTSPRPLDFAEVTIGGIETRQVDPETLASSVVPGLHLAGEMLDVHGDLGGYNLQWAWSSGWLAGQAAGA